MSFVHFLPAHSPIFHFNLSRECLRNLLHNTIIMDACAYQAVLYQTLSQPTVPMAIRLIHVLFPDLLWRKTGQRVQ